MIAVVTDLTSDLSPEAAPICGRGVIPRTVQINGRSGLNIKQGRALLLGPVIGAHVGPGTFGALVRPFHG